MRVCVRINRPLGWYERDTPARTQPRALFAWDRLFARGVCLWRTAGGVAFASCARTFPCLFPHNFFLNPCSSSRGTLWGPCSAGRQAILAVVDPTGQELFRPSLCEMEIEELCRNRTNEGARLRDMRYIYKSVKREAEQRDRVVETRKTTGRETRALKRKMWLKRHVWSTEQRSHRSLTIRS